MIRLGTSVAAVGKGKPGARCMAVSVKLPDGRQEQFELAYGAIRRLDLPVGAQAEVTVEPGGAFDVGAGKGRALHATLQGGVCGLIFDARGRQPFELPAEAAARVEKLAEWAEAMGLYERDPRTLA
jgi:hypothetical protein